MLLLIDGFAWLVAQFTALHWVTLLLGTAPGGIAEKSITAKVLRVGVPVFTAFHVMRLAAALLLVEPMYRAGPAGAAENIATPAVSPS